MSHATEKVSASPMVFPKFSPTANADPAKPDFSDEGQIIKAGIVAPNTTLLSKSVKLSGNGERRQKTLYVESDKDGEFLVQVMLDESERQSGAAVWRNLTDPSNPLGVVPGALAVYTFDHLVRQVRIQFKADAANIGNAQVNAWAFSGR